MSFLYLTHSYTLYEGAKGEGERGGRELMGMEADYIYMHKYWYKAFNCFLKSLLMLRFLRSSLNCVCSHTYSVIHNNAEKPLIGICVTILIGCFVVRRYTSMLMSERFFICTYLRKITFSYCEYTFCINILDLNTSELLVAGRTICLRERPKETGRQGRKQYF